MVKIFGLFALLAGIASAAVVAPAPRDVATSDVTEVAKRDVYGDGTYYSPSVGLGACGWYNSDSDFVVAVSHAEFDTYPGATGNPNANPICGRMIWVWGWTGKSPQLAKIVDRCAGCAGTNDIDMSPALFQATLGDLGIGRAPIGWNWA